MIDEQRGAPHRAELCLDELVEFGQPHRMNLPTITRPARRPPHLSGGRGVSGSKTSGHYLQSGRRTSTRRN
jgi:hypothetical protein